MGGSEPMTRERYSMVFARLALSSSLIYSPRDSTTSIKDFCLFWRASHVSMMEAEGGKECEYPELFLRQYCAPSAYRY